MAPPTGTTSCSCAGRFRIETDGGRVVDMRAGDLFVVRRGVEHKAAADELAVAISLRRRRRNGSATVDARDEREDQRARG